MRFEKENFFTFNVMNNKVITDNIPINTSEIGKSKPKRTKDKFVIF